VTLLDHITDYLLRQEKSDEEKMAAGEGLPLKRNS